MSTPPRMPGAFTSAGVLSIAVIGPDDPRRNAVIEALAGCPNNPIPQLIGYPAQLDDAAKVMMRNCDVVIVELDSDPEFALDLVEGCCVHGSAIVMVYSTQGDPDLIVRCMRAGAREFLRLPFTRGAMAEALDRASARRPVSQARQKADGGLFVFLGCQRRRRSHHPGLQFCGFAGPGVRKEYALDRSQSPPRRRGNQPRNQSSILHCRRPSELQPARFEFSLHIARPL